MDSAKILIPARRGKAAHVRKGQSIRVINTHGEQVVDTWAFVAGDPTEFMSMEHSRAGMRRLTPKIGDTLLTNRRAPILTMLEDTSGGVHDNCQDNLFAGCKELGLLPPETPSPLNLFMNIPWTAEGALSFDPPVSTPGSFVVLRAERDLTIAFSACPQDILPINGRGRQPTEAHFVVV